jgi:hypothetical protein
VRGAALIQKIRPQLGAFGALARMAVAAAVRSMVAGLCGLDGASCTANRIMRFVQISDEHILDDDGQALLGGSLLDPIAEVFSSAQRMQDEYTDEVLNRMIASINGCHAQAPVELVITTGDNTDLAMVNELHRLIDKLDGTFDRVSHFEQQCRLRFPDVTPEILLDFACTRLTGRGTPDTQTVNPDQEDEVYQVPATRTAQQLADTQFAASSSSKTRVPWPR